MSSVSLASKWPHSVENAHSVLSGLETERSLIQSARDYTRPTHDDTTDTRGRGTHTRAHTRTRTHVRAHQKNIHTVKT